MSRAEAYSHAKFHLDPSNRLVTVHERHRPTGQTDNGPIALQTVAQQIEQHLLIFVRIYTPVTVGVSLFTARVKVLTAVLCPSCTYFRNNK